ncbi:unnamed protein product [Brachionus calyciflorus]|uniref:Acrosin n=1 Tax=Brachionus calyciflorus TaxID=104777 RepID=A0A813UXY7_9BILA|nr:unnamed protein product [Brachionus calyciflorus]
MSDHDLIDFVLPVIPQSLSSNRLPSLKQLLPSYDEAILQNLDKIPDSADGHISNLFSTQIKSKAYKPLPAIQPKVNSKGSNSARVKPTGNSKSAKNSPNRKCKIITILIILISIILIAVIATVIGVVVSENNKSSNISSSLLNNCPYGYQGSKCDECGVRYNSNKIIGGSESQSNSWPSIVFIVFKFNFLFYKDGAIKSGFNISLCAGTLINRNTVLTAANCYPKTIIHSEAGVVSVQINSFHLTIGSMFTVYLGTNDMTGATQLLNPSTGIKIGVNSFTIHPEYNASSNLNDIGIIKLEKEVDLTNSIQISCLPMSEKYPTRVDIDAWIAGWGVTSYLSSTLPVKLREANIKIHESSMCNTASSRNWDSQICAGKYDGSVDTCQGDSGGPLVIKDFVNGKEKFILIGLASNGDGCGRTGKPGVYTRVGYFLNWISKF